jgi:hypothetical protein
MRIQLRKPNGERKTVFAGEEFDSNEGWEVMGPMPEDMAIVNKEDIDASRLIADIEGELKLNDGRGLGDWVKTFADPVAKLLGRQDCVSCEVRRVILNATKLVITRQGKIEGRKTIAALLRRSFTESEETVLAELQALLEGRNGSNR